MSFSAPKIGPDFLKHKGIRDQILGHDLVEGHYMEKIIDRAEIKKGQGVFYYHKTFPYPEKGIRDKYAVRSAQLAKRVLLNELQFLTSKKLWPFHLVFLFMPRKIIEHWLRTYLDFIGLDFYVHILEDEFYSALPAEIKNACALFLKLIGISKELADNFASVFGLFIQYDTAYWVRFEDIMSETTKEKLLKNPTKETKRLLDILAKRDPARPHLVKKAALIIKPLRLLLLIPRIRKAFYKTIESINFENLQYDEGDRYNVRNSMRYRFFGMGIKERNEKWPPEQHLWGRVVGLNPDGSPIHDLIVTSGTNMPMYQKQIEEQTKLGY